MEGPQQNCWLDNSAADVYLCNNKLIMTEYQERLTNVDGSTSDRVSLGRQKVCLRLSLKNNLESLILNPQNVYSLLDSFCNLVSLGLLNNSGIFHNNKHENHYQITSKKVLA